MEKIYTTIGVYNNDSFKINGVRESLLLEHIQFNIRHRPGRALFVDGVCLHEGYLTRERADEWEEKIRKDKKTFRVFNDTLPYV